MAAGDGERTAERRFPNDGAAGRASAPYAPNPFRGPGHDAARAARLAMEDVLFSLGDLPSEVDRIGVRDRLLRGVEILYAALDADVIAIAHLQGIGEATAIARECRDMVLRGDAPAAAARLAEAEETLMRGYEEVTRVQIERRNELIGGALGSVVVPARPFRASLGTPALHAFARARLAPHILLGADEPARPSAKKASIQRPTTIEELTAFAAAAASGEIEEAARREEAAPAEAEESRPPPFVFEPAVEEREVLRRIARDCLEDIAIGRSLRVPNAIETWMDQGPFEQRILDNLDAFSSLGGSVLPMVALFVAEAAAPDPDRAFAAALTLGSIEGTDTVASAVVQMKQSDPETYPGWALGFRLASSPSVDVAMGELAQSSRPAWIALGLDVLLARGEVPDDVLRSLLPKADPTIAKQSDPVVATRVARALAKGLPHAEAIGALENLCAFATDDDVFLAAAGSLVRRGHGPVLRLLRAIVAGGSGAPPGFERAAASPSPARVEGSAWLLALAGSASDLDLLLSAAGWGEGRAEGPLKPSVKLVRGLGRFGHAGATPLLVSLLGSDDEDIVAAAAEALDRITGAGLREIVEEPWEVELPKEAEGHGIPVPMRKVEKIVTAKEPWIDWLAENDRRLDRSLKYRAGVPFVPALIVAELEAKVTPPDRRFEAAEELAIVTGLRSRFAADDWVARQRSHLEELRGRVAGLGVTPGNWSYSIDRSAERAPVVQAEERRPAARPAAAPPRALPSFMKAAAAPAETASEALVTAPERVTQATGVAPVAPVAPPPTAPVPAPSPGPAKKIPAALRGTMMGMSPFATKPVLPFQKAAAPSTPDSPDAPAVHRPSVAPPNIALGPDDPGETGTLPAQRSPLAGAQALPFRSAAPAPQPPAQQAPTQQASSAPPPFQQAPSDLPMAQYAEIYTMIWLWPQREAEIRARYHLTDPAAWNVVRERWTARLAADPELASRFRTLTLELYATWVRR